MVDRYWPYLEAARFIAAMFVAGCVLGLLVGIARGARHG